MLMLAQIVSELGGIGAQFKQTNTPEGQERLRNTTGDSCEAVHNEKLALSNNATVSSQPGGNSGQVRILSSSDRTSCLPRPM